MSETTYLDNPQEATTTELVVAIAIASTRLAKLPGSEATMRGALELRMKLGAITKEQADKELDASIIDMKKEISKLGEIMGACGPELNRRIPVPGEKA